MPITAAGKPTMQQSIKQAFIEARDNGSLTGADSDAIIDQLSTNIAEAVHSYVTSIVVTINPGISVTGVAGVYPVVAMTVTPGTS